MAFTNLYKRSIYFEILSVNENGEAISLLESFAFTLPPENIEITYGQRTTITPTVGGNWVDRNGLGNAKISIGGETGNNESRMTVLGAGRTPRFLTGEECWFEFRDRIIFFSSKRENFIMRFYDLTHKGVVAPYQTGTDAFSKGYSEAWEVVLQDSSSLRTAKKPFFYPYKIQLEGVKALGLYNPATSKNKIGFLSNLLGYIDDINEAILAFSADLELFLANGLEYINEITDIFSAVNAFSALLESFCALIIEYEQKLGGFFGDVLSESEDILKTGIQLISYPYFAVETAREQWKNVVSQTQSLMTTARVAGRGAIDLYDWGKETDQVSQIENDLNDIEKPVDNIMQISKQSASDEPIGAVSINDSVTLFYGYTTVVVQGNTRLDTLARDIYGDASYKDLIAAVNGIYTIDDLEVGALLKLPVLTPVTRNSNNQIYNLPENKDDLLGNNASVDESGVFELISNDYALVGGDDNLNQAVYHRLLEQRDRQIRDNTYGIIADIGRALDSESSVEFLRVSLKETLLADPRIIDVYDLSFQYNGDKLYLQFRYDSTTKFANIYKERV